ncbi:MAG: aspartate aminotransferase family protein [Actinomycetota bacterium]
MRRSTQLSDKWSLRASRRLPGGVNSNVRLDGPSIFFERGRGAWLWDIDGNDYVDYLLGQGPAFLGHAPEPILAAVSDACRRGMVFGSQHELEVEAAELLCDILGWPDMVRFGSSGTEVVQAALRVARAATGRAKFVRFEGHYHGWLDNVLMVFGEDASGPASDGQLAHHLDDCLVLGWNDLNTLRDLLEAQGSDVAAILMEPMMLNAGAIEPRPGYLEGVRSLCDRYGVVLIFDEIITGFRLSLGGAAERFGVIPDLATYGKAMAGGWPGGALVGRAELMEPIGTRKVNHSGTFNANLMSAAAVVASLEYLKQDPPYERLERITSDLTQGLLELAEETSTPLRIQGVPGAFHASVADTRVEVRDFRDLARLDADAYLRLVDRMIASGIWLSGRGIWYVSAAHGEDEVGATLDRCREAFSAA